MTEQNAKSLAHEMTLEYVKNLHILSDPAIDNIPRMVEKFASINKMFYDAIMLNETLDKLYK